MQIDSVDSKKKAEYIGKHSVSPREYTGCMCVAEWFRCGFAPCFLFHQYAPPAGFYSAAWCSSAEQLELQDWRDPVVITESESCKITWCMWYSFTLSMVLNDLYKTSDLWTSGRAPHNMKFCWWSKTIWSGINTDCFILKISTMFLSDFLSHLVGFCAEWWAVLWPWSRCAAEPMEAHTHWLEYNVAHLDRKRLQACMSSNNFL